MMRPRALVSRSASLIAILALTAGFVTLAAPPSGAFQIPQSQVVSAVPVAWTPNILDGKVEAIVQVGNRMIAAGTFSQARNATGGTTYSRPRILAFDATTGVIDTAFAPNVNGEITSMVVSPEGGTVIIAGAFTSVNGTAVQRLAKLNATSGALIPTFAAKAPSRVNDIALWGSTTLVIGGQFTKINNIARTSLAAVNTTTGALDARLNLVISGLFNGGTTNIKKLDVSPDGTKLIIVGDFTAVSGEPRVQIAMVDLSTNPATLSSWATARFEGGCASVFDTYMRDVEFSPDNAYFVVADTGAGYFPSTLCDTVTRWPSDAIGPDQDPSWAAYSGGDTITAVAVTGTTIYAGGHMRWMNNDAVGDVAAGGAVSRDGLAALDPQNGVPLAWNPTRNRGVGVFAFLATPTGLWIGHDTTTVAHMTHNRIAFFPLAGGTSVATGQNATVPGELFNTARTICPAADTSILYRVNAGGPETPANDCGPAWEGDQDFDSAHRNSGSNTGGPWSLGAGVTSSVPEGTPRTLFDTERWSPSDNPPMQWSFPVPDGRHVQVRLYFSNGYDGTSQPGQRIFNVSIDNAPVLTNYDIVADVGNKIGTMKPFNITSDGDVNIDFSHVVENPLINGIEIVDLDAPPMPQPEFCVGNDTSILYRVNAGGPTVAPYDCGSPWVADQTDPSLYRNDGSFTGAWDPVLGVDASVPSTTPRDVLRTERWSPSDNPSMDWAFPVDPGTNIRVRLYFANGYPGTSQPGQRVFDVSIDGTPVLQSYDIVADVGDRTGVMKSFDIVSDGDGMVNIDFAHETENPLVNAIEIIDLDAPPGPQPMSSANFLGHRTFDGATLGSDGSLNTPGTDWSDAAGAFYLNGKLYAGWTDGGLYSWTFNGTTLGPKVDVLLQGNYVYGRTWTSFTDVTGMFWCDGKLYYTRSGDQHLFYRYFSPASELVGSIQYVVSGPGVDSLDWSGVQGMTEASGHVYYATNDGNLSRIDFVNGRPVEGTSAALSGPGIDGRDWRTNAMFILPEQAPDIIAPTVPGKPTGVAHTTTSIDLTWAASTDQVSSNITYKIYRDGGTSSIGQIVSSSTGTVSFTDSTVTPGSTHSYQVDATDDANNTSDKSTASDQISVPTSNPPIFADSFGAGNFSAWTSNTRLTIDATQGSVAAPSARMSQTNQSAWAYKDLTGSFTSVCISANIKITSQTTAVDLLRLRSAGNGPVVKAYITAADRLAIRSDFAGTQLVSATSMPIGSWNTLELCGSVGAATPWDLYLNGTKVIAAWVANTGGQPVTRAQIGDTSARTVTVNWDDVVVDQTPG